jgi:hypothetical protein
MLPHYQSLETFVDRLWDPPSFWSGKSLVDKYWRGTDGRLVTVPAGPNIDFVSPLFIQSAMASGLPLAAQGFNDPDPVKQIGVEYYDINI